MARRARAECQDCGQTWTGSMAAVAEAVEDHEQFHDVRIEPVATDGGTAPDLVIATKLREVADRIEQRARQPVADGGDVTYYVLDERRAAVVDGPFDSQAAASEAAADHDGDVIVATERALDIVEGTSETTIRWENEDVDVVTDGGHPPGPGGAAAPPEGWRRDSADAVRQHAGVGDQTTNCTHTDGPVPCFDCLVDGGESP